jgi:ubiquinone/menaquinone biosynthesis C-methylase UbiE
MSTNIGSVRRKKVVAWAVLGIFLLGFFYAPIGTWTGTILGAWFVGTQRVRRGFLWMLGFALLFTLPHLWRQLPHTGLGPMAVYVGWALLAVMLSVLPFTFYRMASPHLSGFLPTMTLPLYGVALMALRKVWLPAAIGGVQSPRVNGTLLQVGAVLGATALLFLVDWFAAVMVWMWNHEFRGGSVRAGASVFAATFALAIGFGVFRQFNGEPLPSALPLGAAFAGVCIAGAAVLSGWALLRSRKDRGWKCRPEILSILQSPATGESLHLVRQGSEEVLTDSSNERFPIRAGIPDLRRPEDFAGSNQKLNHLYETIGGFYDDTQRVACALSGIDRDAYVMSYLGLLEVKAGDSVLETSVGTGLNFKYLPRGVKLSGIDLSAEMLAHCQSNLRRWHLEADLLLGNAESLPFADSSFDVVFHVGGINFFNDRAKAIREMIRVARPGSRILIADETEEHVKAAYERTPVIGRYLRNRKELVVVPIDLVPPEMLETHVEILHVVGKDRFYALTFRKPANDGSPSKSESRNTDKSVTSPCLSQ